jgi:hypothetical protein
MQCFRTLFNAASQLSKDLIEQVIFNFAQSFFYYKPRGALGKSLRHTIVSRHTC